MSDGAGVHHERRRPCEAPPLERTASSWAARPTLIRITATVAVALGGVYLTWRIVATGRGVHPVLFGVLFAAEVYGWVSLVFFAYLAWRVPRSAAPPLPARLPSVDVFLCTYDEPGAVLEPTLAACRAISLPHTTYVLDDGRRPQVEKLAHRHGAVYVTRPDNEDAKAGNINHALPLTNGELILFLDADHVPRHDILDATVGFFNDPDVALVQTPHDFYNRDSVQHTRAVRHEQTLFYEVIAPGKDRDNAMFWCGSATVVRRTALEEVGGVLTDTVAEDFHTTIAMHARGWRTRYHSDVLVQGIAPTDLAGFLLQRFRWARGNLRVFRTKENPLTSPGLTGRQRLSYFASLFTYFNGLQRAALLGVLAWTLGTGRLPMHASAVALVLLWAPWAVLAFVATGALGRGTLGPLDSTRYGLMTMGIHIRAVGSLLADRTGTFKVTPKEGIDTGGVGVLRMLPLVTAFAAVLTAVLGARIGSWVGIVSMPAMPDFARAVTIAFGVWELGCIVAVLAGLVRRRQLRTHYRFPVELRARIAGTPSIVRLLDLSPEGLAYEAPSEVLVGERHRLLTRLPDAWGELADVSLPVEVRSCRPDPGTGGYRVGCRLHEPDPRDRRRVVEYCFVVLPAHQRGVVMRRPDDALDDEAAS